MQTDHQCVPDMHYKQGAAATIRLQQLLYGGGFEF